MEKVVEFTDRKDLIEILGKEFKPWGLEITDSDIKIEPYCYDERINWDTYLVTIKNKKTIYGYWFFGSMKPDFFGVIGYANGPV